MDRRGRRSQGGVMTRTPVPVLGFAGARARATRSVRIPADGLRIVLVVTALLLALLFTLTAVNLAGAAVLWENAHWTLSAGSAVALAFIGARRITGVERRARAVAGIALAVYLGGEVLWDVQVGFGIYPVPAPSDVLFLGMAVPFLVAIGFAVQTAASRGQVRTFALDATILAAAIMAVVFFAYEPVAAGAVTGLGTVLLLYPIVYFGLAGAMIVAALLMRSSLGPHGLYLASAGTALLGFNWVWYLAAAIAGEATTGSVVNMLRSVGTVMIGLGVASWRLGVPPSDRLERTAARALAILPVGAIASAAAIELFAEQGLSAISLVEAATAVVVLLAIIRQTLLLGDQRAFAARERLASERERELREGAQQALAARETSEARYRTLVEVFHRLGEQTTLAADEDEMFAAAAAALAKLVPSPAGDILAINASTDRLCVRIGWGDRRVELGSAVDIEAPDRCLGIRRGSIFVVEDASEAWASSCPAFPVDQGSTTCVPMVASGKIVAVAHLARPEPNAFAEDDLRQAGRIADQVALAISNTRLLRTMEGLAMTDGLTGLHNARFFDPFLDRELAIAEREDISIGIIAIDLDHFKAFNDTHGHAAGDEALRAFARACLGVLRNSDTMARVGGEEFAIAVRGADLAATAHIAEKLRAAVQRVSVEIGPGRFASLTASFGVAGTTEHGTGRKRLLKVADRALYAAKQAGRDTVVTGAIPPKSVNTIPAVEPVARAGGPE